MIQETEVREKLIHVLQHRESLEAFEDWLVARSWNMHVDSTANAQRMVGAVEGALAEYSNGHLDESELRDRLRALMDHRPSQ